MHPRLFALAADPGYFRGLMATLNSIYAYHAAEIPVFIYQRKMTEEHLGRLHAHPLRPQIWHINDLPTPPLGMWEAKQQIFAHCMGRVRVVMLLDADLVLTSDMNDVFEFARAGKIVSGADGGGPNCGAEYAAYDPKLVGSRHPYINTGAVCMDVQRHWDVAGLWAFTANYGAYGPTRGWPLGLPGHGDQGLFHGIAAHLGKTEHYHCIPERLWADCTTHSRVEVRGEDERGRLEVWNLNASAKQRLVHSPPKKWWSDDAVRHYARYGDKLRCFLHFDAWKAR